jgi:hypothetical protein
MTTHQVLSKMSYSGPVAGYSKSKDMKTTASLLKTVNTLRVRAQGGPNKVMHAFI